MASKMHILTIFNYILYIRGLPAKGCDVNMTGLLCVTSRELEVQLNNVISIALQKNSNAFDYGSPVLRGQREVWESFWVSMQYWLKPVAARAYFLL